MISLDIHPPHNCFECPCLREDNLGTDYMYQCNVTLHVMIDIDGNMRPNWCPIVDCTDEEDDGR